MMMTIMMMAMMVMGVNGAPVDDDSSDEVATLKNDADHDGRLSFEEIAAFLQAS